MILEGLAGSFVAQDLDKAFLLEAGGAAGELGPDLQGFLHIVAHGKLHFEIIPYAKLGLALYPGQAGTDSLFCFGKPLGADEFESHEGVYFPFHQGFYIVEVITADLRFPQQVHDLGTGYRNDELVSELRGILVPGFVFLKKLEGCAQLELKKLRFYPDEALRMIQIGLPAGLQSVIFNISNVMIQSSINSFGADVVAANTAAGNLDSFIYTACNSVYHASMTFTSQNLGAGKPERIKPVYRDCILTVLLIGVPMCALLYFFGQPLLGIYIAKDDPAYASVIASGMVRVTYMGMTYFVCGIMETCCGMVRGLGRSWMPMVVTIFGACVLRIIWIYTIFQTHHTLDVLYLSYPVSWVVTSAVHVLCFILIYRRMMARWNAHKEEENASY